jgi:hypothetical protein
MAWTEAEAQKTANEVLKRAASDNEFRKLLLSDPKAAVAKVDPTPLPPGFKIKAFDNNHANATVVLPDMVTDGELSDAELEQVAGGGGSANRCGGSCAASCVFSSIF